MAGAQRPVAQSATVPPSGAGTTDEALFAREAAGTGLTLPRAHPLNLWLSVAAVVVIVVAAVAVGEYTGWAVGPHRGSGSLGLYGAQDCRAAIAPVTVQLAGAVADDAGAPWATSFAALGGLFSTWTGGCVNVSVAAGTGDGYDPLLSSHTAFFAANSLPPSGSDRVALNGTVATVPGALVAVEVVYNVPALSAPLRLNASVLAGIYSGGITQWSAAPIAALNPGVDLPSGTPILPIYRDGSSGVNLPFTQYLTAGSTTWASTVGSGASVDWPTGIGAPNASSMAADVAANVGAIGYVESIAPLPANGTAAALESPNSTFVLPTTAAVRAAALAEAHSAAFVARDWANVSIVDAPGSNSYPVVECAYVTMYANLGSAYGSALSFTNATWLVSFVWWLVSNASSSIVPLGFTPDPGSFEGTALSLLENESYNSINLVGENESGEGGETGEF